jgi:hypothetical protein
LNFCPLFFFLLICKMWCHYLLVVNLLYSSSIKLKTSTSCMSLIFTRHNDMKLSWTNFSTIWNTKFKFDNYFAPWQAVVD